MKRARWLLGAALSFTVTQAAVAADLSPSRWPAAERAQLEREEMVAFPPSARTIEGRSELVSATLSPIAVHAGMEALRQGGTAADGAIAVALTQVATDLGAVVSYAGVAELVYYDARTRKVYAMDAGWGSYAGENDPASIRKPDLNLIPGAPAAGASASGAYGRETLTPGFMAGMEAAHQRFGRLPFADLFQPAIWYARHGVTVSPLLAKYFQWRRDVLARTDAGRRFLAQAGGASPKAGDRFVQPELADFLSHVAEDGARYMYDGPWARAFVDAVRREGGAATFEDLRRYRVVWEQPLSVGFGDATVVGPGSTNVGGCSVLQALNLLDALGVSRMGSYWSDPTAFATYAKVLRFAQLGGFYPATLAFERAHGLGSTCPGRLTKAYAQVVAPAIDEITRGVPAADAGHHSDSVVVVDRWGDVAALVHSSNTAVWGDTGIVVGGVPIPNAAGLNAPRLAKIAPGDHAPGDMAPVIALRNGRPVLAIATVGVSLTPETVRLAAGLLGGTATLPALAAAPPLLFNFSSPPGGDLSAQPVEVPAGAYGEAFQAALKAQGLSLQEIPAAQAPILRGTAAIAFRGSLGRPWTSAEAPHVVLFGAAR